MTLNTLIDALKSELDVVKARLAVDDEMMSHLHEIYFIAFTAWYDPTNEAHREIGNKIWPHITALNDRLRFKP